MQTARLVALTLSGFLITGCWDRQEINDIAFVIANGMDVAPHHKYEVSTQIAIPSGMGMPSGGNGGNKNGEAFYVDAGVGNTVRDANADLQRKLSRRLNFSHMRVSLIGQTLARQGIGPVLDVYGRNPQVRLPTYLFVTRGKAVDFLESAKPALERIPAEQIREIALNGQWETTTVKDFLVHSLEWGTNPVVPILSLTPSVTEGKKRLEIVPVGLAVFRSMRMVGEMGKDESLGLFWVHNRRTGAEVTFPLEVSLPAKESATCQILSSQAKVETSRNGREIRVSVGVTVHAGLAESSVPLEFIHREFVHSIEQSLNQKIKIQVLKAVRKAKRLDTDVFGFGTALWRQHPESINPDKERWEDLFPHVSVDVKVDSHIDHVGMLTGSLYSGKESGK
jgi:spore germination protein KC